MIRFDEGVKLKNNCEILKFIDESIADVQSIKYNTEKHHFDVIRKNQTLTTTFDHIGYLAPSLANE